MSRSKIILLVLTIFLSGAVVGAFGATAYLRRNLELILDGPPPEPSGMLLARLTRELDLTPTQQEAARAAFKDLTEHFRTAHKELKSRLEPLLDQAVRDLRTVLDPAQSSRLDGVLERIKRMQPPPHGEGKHPGGPPSHGEGMRPDGPPPPPREGFEPGGPPPCGLDCPPPPDLPGADGPGGFPGPGGPGPVPEQAPAPGPGRS